jgi:hypothetical protein
MYEGQNGKNQPKLANTPYILGKMSRAYTPYILGWREYLIAGCLGISRFA